MLISMCGTLDGCVQVIYLVLVCLDRGYIKNMRVWMFVIVHVLSVLVWWAVYSTVDLCCCRPGCSQFRVVEAGSSSSCRLGGQGEVLGFAQGDLVV